MTPLDRANAIIAQQADEMKRLQDELAQLERHVTLLREALLDKEPFHGYYDRTCDYQRIEDAAKTWRARRQAALEATEP